MNARATLGAVSCLMAMALIAATGYAAETERVVDGGFEATTCSGPTMCENPNWAIGDVQARFCSGGSGGNCTADAATGAAFARFGYMSYSNISPILNDGRIEQPVLIPEAPATLSYRLRFNNAPATNVSLAVTLDGAQLDLVSSGTANWPGYATRSVDLAPNVSATPQTLAFRMSCAGTNGQLCDAFDVDDVSIVTGTDLPGGGASAPETTLTRTPGRKTKSKRAQFEFSSSAPDATFECALDGKGFSACNSPRLLKVARGRHNFQVRASAAGLTDATPASHDWKVKKKRRRR